MAEIELSALVRQCLDRLIPDKETMIKEVKAWQDQRNSAVVKVHWQFTTADARVKLKSLYPKIKVWQSTGYLYLSILIHEELMFHQDLVIIELRPS